jgi:uncharacterized LabA/DUF88 family protein
LSQLYVFVDYDNVEDSLRLAGPVNLAKIIALKIPSSVVLSHTDLVFRLYGGWRVDGLLTHVAQGFVPIIQQQSPVYISIDDAGTPKQIRLIVELADKPFGASTPLQDSFVKDRDLRNFRSKSIPWPDCKNARACGFKMLVNVTQSMVCPDSGCNTELRSVLVRDEQKMVDTLIVADIAYIALNQRATDVVLVSSDADIWPGVLLAVRAGCNVSHIHSKSGRKTPRHLLVTLDSPVRFYDQMSL